MGTLSLILRPEVLCFGFGNRDQVGCSRSLQGDQIQGTETQEAPVRPLGKRKAAGLGPSLDLGPLDLVFLEAALADDLITTPESLHAPLLPTPFWILQHRKVSFLPNFLSLYPHL